MTLQNNRYFQIVREHIDHMLEFGRGEDCPLFGGVIDPTNQQVIVALSPPPPGIRMTDFNWCGNNFMHDIPLLEVMIALTKLTGDQKYDAAADEMFAFYGKHGAHPETGLFGWGEHGQWSFADRKILPCTFTNGLAMHLSEGYMVHDHLRCAPGWFWDRMWKHHPETVVRFAKGLNGHIVDEKTFEHNRHAALTANWWRDPKKPDFDKGKDFARHAGFHIIDCLFAYRRSGDSSLLDWSRGIMNWHLSQRLSNGIIRGCVRTPGYDQEGQHDSFALSIADAADILGRDTAEGREFASHADELFDARRKQYAGTAPEVSGFPSDERLWIQGYFRKSTLPLPPGGNLLALIHQRTGIDWYAEKLKACGQFVNDHLPEPPSTPTLARAFHQHLEMLLLAHLQTNDAPLLDGAQRVADWAIKHLRHEGMICGAAGYAMFGTLANFEWHCDPWINDPPVPGYYYSVTGTPLLIRSMLHLALIESGEDDILGPDLHRR